MKNCPLFCSTAIWASAACRMHPLEFTREVTEGRLARARSGGHLTSPAWRHGAFHSAQSNRQVNTHYSIGAIMRSGAARKFNSLHPDSHLNFQNILASAKLQKDSPEPRSGEMSDEVSNMQRNTFLTRARRRQDLARESPGVQHWSRLRIYPISQPYLIILKMKSDKISLLSSAVNRDVYCQAGLDMHQDQIYCFWT